MATLNLILMGATVMAGFIISLFFLRFWRTTKDRFFLFFSLSFLIEGMGRLIGGLAESSDDYAPIVYSIRLFAFLVILFAIIDKNLKSKQS